MGGTVYKKFLELINEIYDLGKVESLLGWDGATHMPSGSARGRAKVDATIASTLHEKLTSIRMKGYLERLDKPIVYEKLSPEEKANVREIRRLYERETCFPSSLVKELAEATSLSERVWEEARRKSDFKMFKPYLEELVELKKQAAEHINDHNLYDALIDEFEPYTTAKEIDRVFSELKKSLVPIVKAVFSSQVQVSDRILGKKFGVKKQEGFGLMVLKDMGFDFETGRLDVSVHPFTSGSCDDVRITTRYSVGCLESLFSTLHEGGHAMYEQGFKKEHYRTPMADSISMAYHESQSRLWENLVGRSEQFWNYYYLKLKARFRSQLKGVGLKDFYKAINKVEPSFIRVDADELTYNLHVLLRYDLEKDLFEDELRVGELPHAWDEKIEEYLGIVPKNDALGVLQDVHWSAGYFGYFPTYTLGNLYSVQIYNKIREGIPTLEADISKGNFRGLKEWLNKNIHQCGKMYSAKELTQKITGELLNPEHFIDYLKKKYGEIYEVSL